MADALKIKTMSRPIDVPEWAMRHGMGIASKHVVDGTARFELAADIAEALSISVDLALLPYKNEK